jgi:hypothetical protein
MFILAGLTLLCGVQLFVGSQQMDWDTQMKLMEQVYGPEFMAQMKTQGLSPEMMKMGMGVTTGIIVAIGILFILLGLFVRRGSFGAIITSAIFTVPIILMSLCSTGIAGLMLLKVGPLAILQAIWALLPLVTSVTLMVYLVKAGKISRHMKRVQDQMRMQMWQAQQQQAGNAPAGYGYGTPGTVAPQHAPQHPFGPLPPPP